jgi:hypothetical protein
MEQLLLCHIESQQAHQDRVHPASSLVGLNTVTVFKAMPLNVTIATFLEQSIRATGVAGEGFILRVPEALMIALWGVALLGVGTATRTLIARNPSVILHRQTTPAAERPAA